MLFDTWNSSRMEKEYSMWGKATCRYNGVTLWRPTEFKKQKQKHGCQSSSHIYYFYVPGKQSHDMITVVKGRQIESISVLTLNLLKGNIIVPKSSFDHSKLYKENLLYLTRQKEVLNQKRRILPALVRLIAALAADLYGNLFK